MLALFGDNMHSPAANLGRKTAPSLKRLFAVMAGFLVVFVILAELASATTNDQPAISQVSNQTPATASATDNSTSVAPVAEPSETVRPNSLSYGANEVVKMYKGGVKADVLLTYIETSNLSYQLSSREILYLSQAGVPSEIVNAMIRRDHQVQLAKADARQQTETVSAQVEATPVVYSQPQTTVVVQPRSRVKYVAPVCTTPVSTSPNVTIIGSRYGSTFFNECYNGSLSYSPRAFYNYEFGNQCWTSPYYGFGSGYRNRFAYGSFNGAYGRFGHGRHWGRF